MTPLAMRRAAEDIAAEVQTDTDAQLRGTDLGKAVAADIRERGPADRFANRAAGLDVELALLHLASRRDELLGQVATSALHAFRQAREKARNEAEAGQALSSSQCRRARKLLGWTQRALEERSGVDLNYISRFERTGTILSNATTLLGIVERIRTVLEAAGVEFTDGAEPGVKLRRAKS